MYTINNATIIPAVTDAVLGSVDLSCRSAVCFNWQRLETQKDVKGCGTNVASSSLSHMFPSLAILSQCILWFRCLRRLDVTVGYANVKTCVTISSVCSSTYKMTTCICFPRSAELRFLHTCREPDVFPCCCVENGTSLLWFKRTRIRPCQNYGYSWTIVQSCAVATTGDFLCRIPKSASLR